MFFCPSVALVSDGSDYEFAVNHLPFHTMTVQVWPQGRMCERHRTRAVLVGALVKIRDGENKGLADGVFALPIMLPLRATLFNLVVSDEPNLIRHVIRKESLHFVWRLRIGVGREWSRLRGSHCRRLTRERDAWRVTLQMKSGLSNCLTSKPSSRNAAQR